MKATQVCIIQGCTAPFLARGWCRKHYSRWRKTGNAETPLVRSNPLARFERKVDKGAPGGCWQWLGTTKADGYGLLSVDGKYRQVHRWAYETFKGSIPDGLVIDHLCRNRACANPEHLEPVTSGENSLRGQAPHVLLHHEKRCKRGHAVTGDNLYVRPSKPTQRVCRTCRRSYVKGK